MSAESGKPSAYFRKSWRAIITALTLGVDLGLVVRFPDWFARERLGRFRPFLVYFQPLVIGYALGRVHQLAYQREYHSDAREPKGGAR